MSSNEKVEEKKGLDLASVLSSMMDSGASSGTDAVLKLASRDDENLPAQTWLKEPSNYSRAQLLADYQEMRGFDLCAELFRSACGWQYVHLRSKDGRLIEKAFDTLGRIIALENQALMSGGSPVEVKKQSLLGRLRGR